jgi:hypothetical protein
MLISRWRVKLWGERKIRAIQYCNVDKLKLSLCLIKHHDKNTYGQVEVQFHSVLTWPSPHLGMEVNLHWRWRWRFCGNLLHFNQTTRGHRGTKLETIILSCLWQYFIPSAGAWSQAGNPVNRAWIPYCLSIDCYYLLTWFIPDVFTNAAVHNTTPLFRLLVSTLFY